MTSASSACFALAASARSVGPARTDVVASPVAAGTDTALALSLEMVLVV